METTQEIKLIVYINLENRKDRRESIERELKFFDSIIPIIRINANYKPKYGGLGCSLSHLTALKYAKNNNFTNVLICEDDFVLYPEYKNNVSEIVNNAIRSIPNYDVIMFASNTKTKSKYNEYVDKIIDAQTRTAYLVNEKFYDTLLLNYKECVKLQKKYGPAMYDMGHAGDQYWKKLQPLSEWYVLKNKIGYQIKSYSDIQKKIVDYKV